MNTPPTEDPELARLIERDLDGDPEARQALDARLAADPDTALAFAQAHRLEALLAEHHTPPARSPFTALQRPLAWLAVAASLVFLAWAAFHNPAPAPSVAKSSAPAPEPPRRKILSPLLLPSPASEPRKTTELSAAEIEAKASRFFIPEITVNAATPEEAIKHIESEFRRIATRHGDKSAESIRFEAEGFDDAPARPVRFTAAAHLDTLLAAVALQSGGLLGFADGRMKIQRVQASASTTGSVIKSFNFPESLRPLLTGEAPAHESRSGVGDDYPFITPVASRIVPSLVLENVTLDDAIALLRLKIHELDPEGLGLNIVVKKPPSGSPDWKDERITRDLSGVTVESALESIAEAVDLKAEAQDHAYVIASPADPIFQRPPIEFSLPGLKASMADDGGPFVAIEGNEALVDAAGANLAKLKSAPTQILITSKFVCALPSDLMDPAGAEAGVDLARGDQIIDDSQYNALVRMAKESEGSAIKSSPSVVTRAMQRSKIEIIREILYREPEDDGSFTVETIPAGWTLETIPTPIGEAVHLTGTVEFSSLKEFPGAKDLDGELLGIPNSQRDPESLPLGDPTHKWALDFEAELQNGQHALLDFMDLADGKKVYVFIKATLIDPSGQPLIPQR